MKVISQDKMYEVKKCDSFLDKLIGFMFTKRKKEYGLCFDNCSIHTFFCLQPLDIILLDEDYNVLFIYPHVKCNKIILKKKNIKYILEFSSGILDLKSINILK